MVTDFTGRIANCLEEEVVHELQNGGKFTLTKGMTYDVADDLSSHRSSTKDGVKLIIIDGDFLKQEYEVTREFAIANNLGHWAQ